MLTAELLDPYAPGWNGDEWITCHVFNHEGVREAAKMPRAYWAYLFWLDEHGHLDANEFFVHCCKRFPTRLLDAVLMNCVAELSCERWKAGLERPAWAGALLEMPESWHEFCRKYEVKY